MTTIHNIQSNRHGLQSFFSYFSNNDVYTEQNSPNYASDNPFELSHNLRRMSESESGGGGAKGGELVLDLVMVIVCVVCAGFASGLTQGLLSLDHMEMTIKAQSGNVKEKEYAAKLLPVISQHHLLLVTLMLWNASATEALPIFLSGLVPEYVAIIISVTLEKLFQHLS
jgi:hypothetical protein